MIKQCAFCGKEFEAKGGRRYCSVQCRERQHSIRVDTDELNGQKFGDVTVTGGFRTNNRLYAICQCSCGKVFNTRYELLKNGETTSCGHKNFQKTSTLDLSGKVNKNGVIALKRMERQGSNRMWLCKCGACGKEFKISANHFPQVQSCGCLAKKFHQDIIRKAHEVNKIGRIDGTSVSALTMRRSSANTSGIKGVYWHKAAAKWSAYIEFKGKRYYLGLYEKKEDAAEARRAAENALFGNFLNWFKEEHPDKWEILEKNKKKK